MDITVVLHRYNYIPLQYDATAPLVHSFTTPSIASRLDLTNIMINWGYRDSPACTQK